MFFPHEREPSHAREVVPQIYEVRNHLHMARKSLTFIRPGAHPLGQGVVGLQVLAEAATFMIRKTVIEILKRGWRDKFKDQDAREHSGVMKYALPKNQGRRRLRELKESLKALEQGG